MQNFGSKMLFFGPKSIFFGNYPTFFVTTMTGHQKDNIFVLTTLHNCPQKNGFGQKTAFLDPKRATLGNRGHEKARQAAKRPPTGKPKVSRVTSGYGGYMIPFSQIPDMIFVKKNYTTGVFGAKILPKKRVHRDKR